MDSYDLFGEDGAGMLEGLSDLGGDHFEPAVTGARDAAPSYAQPTYTQENPLQKLVSFGGTDFSHMDPNAQNMYAQGYGTERPMGPPGGPYQHQRQLVRPPVPQTTPTGQYPYQPDNMYSMPDHQLNMGDAAGMQGWSQHSGYPLHRYGQMGSYRQQPMAAYSHQQEQKHQFPPTQHPIMQQPHQTAYTMQQRHTPHYPQSTAYSASAGQAYSGYMHQRLPHHHQYPQTHHQIEMGVSQTQQYNHMSHATQALSTHTAQHAGPTPGHMTQPHTASQPHTTPTQQPSTQNHLTHPNTMGYGQTPLQPIQPIQRPMEVATTPQQYPTKHASTSGPGPGVLGNGSPQYRAPFPQLSPQLSSPRPQMSPRPQAPQMSPRPVMSPAKPNASPHPQMQQSNLSPRPATSITPKSTTASPVPMPVYSQQSTLQALEQMVMPPTSTNNPEYPSYPPRSSLVPPQTLQNPLSPAIGLRNPVMEQQWPPMHHSRPHLPNVSGGIGIVEQSQNIPQSQSLPPTQSSSITNLQSNSQSIEPISYGNDDIHSDISNKLPSLPEVNIPISQESILSHNMPPSISQSDYMPLRSPVSTNIQDKPSSTTNTSDISAPNSIHELPLSHPPTPTPSSTTDDNATNNQESSLPPHIESLKSIEENSNSSSSATQLPSQSQNNTTNFTDFTNVSSMTNYTKTVLQPLKSNNMDDLMPINVPIYNQEPLVPIQISTANQVVPTTIAQLSQLQHSSPLNNMSIIQNQTMSSSQTPPISMSYTQLGQMPASSMLSNASNIQLPPSLQPVHQTPPPNLPVTQLNSSATNLPMGQTNLSTVPVPSVTNLVSQPLSQSQHTVPNIPPHSQSPNVGHPNMQNIAPHSQAPNLYDQNSSVMPPNGMGMVGPPRPMQHGLPMGIPGLGGPGIVHGMMPTQDMGYQPPISHHQERAALQQQLQELYCMPPAPEHQDKIAHLQERLNILGQHEANDQCNGGPQCILQSPIFTSPMIDSPQVSSTTGRGRSKGAPRTKKPRQKKGEKDITPMGMLMPSQPLPVSEDCVTAGAGLHIPSHEITELSMDPIIDMDLELQKKPRGIRKPREPKKPKEPKPPKIPKEKKKKEPKEPKDQRVKRKYVRKKKFDMEDSITDDSFNKSAESSEELTGDVSQTSQIILQEEISTPEPEEEIIPETVKEAELVQADSQTPSEDILEPGEIDIKKDEYQFDEHSNSNEEIEKMIRKTPKRVKPPTVPKKVVSYKGRSSKGSGSGKSRKRKGQVTVSDGEGEDLVSTPPPSPPEDSESAIQKRRSARNTQRKKYVDDVVLRFSDDDSPNIPARSRKPTVPPAPLLVATPAPSLHEIFDEPSTSNLEAGSKPNFVYVNTTDEDSMVVQYVLASRMTKREQRVEVGHEEAKEKVNEDGTETKVEDEAKSDDIIVDTPVADIPKENAESEILSEVKYETVMADVEEYYVKYRNFSYLHCEWKTEDELFKGDKRIANKIKRFKQKQQLQLNIFEYLDDESFNPDYIEVDRVLDVAEHVDPNSQETIKHYLVKWRSLQYEDSTWELEEDVDPFKIQQFILFKTVPPKDKWKPKRRQHPDLWTKLDKSPIYKGNNSLREYQLEGLNWLLFSWHNARNCILADEMGLGKTIQSLTFLHAVHEFGIKGPFLIIAPLSTIPNWQREIEAWTDLNVVVYHGSSASRSMLQEYEYHYKNDKGQPIKEITKFNILITTFEIIVTDVADLKGFAWRVCIIDEAHRLKNRNCKLLEGLRQLNLEHRVLLSGTPLQNNVNELFSLLNFLEPSQFTNSEVFLQEFGDLKSEHEVQKLQCILKPMMLRRLKEDVEKSLAPKEETVVEVELTNIQKKYYRGILERNFSFLQKGTTQANIPNLMNTMMELRKCCIHPYLLNGAEDQIQYDFKTQHGEDVDSYYKSLIHSSGKMVLIDKLLPKLRANGHRVLLFSQMVRCLDILEDYLMYRKYPYERIDGRIRGNLRQAAIDRFSRPDSDRFVFLLCTKAGGLGINLTAADTVIIYDSDWNPQNDLQAQARCHRIGQQKMVKIYRLLCRNTYEREMFDKASLKLGLDKAVLQSMNTSQSGKDSGNRQLSKKEIEDLLKKGAYGALLDEENDGDKFCEEDIEMILARRTQVITMESEKGSTFSKASFASSANRSDINIDDPDFWNKWAKRADIDTTEKDETEDLVLSEPRRRTQIKRYGHDESAIDMSELETSSVSDSDGDGLSSGMRSRRSKKLKKRLRSDDYIPREGERGDIVYGSWARRECFMVERGLLTFGWGRWREILDHSQLRKGWKESDIEDCARVILLFCLRFYRGDEKIRSFIWDLITPCEYGEGMQITRNHHGLKDPVPRGIRNKNKKKSKDSRHAALTDPNHWSKNEKFDGDIFLESNYKKHLGRHANKVLLRVRMLYYIKHEIIGDLVQHIADGVHASALPINPPITEQLPCEWWDTECDKSLMVGTWKHGYESYAEMRADPTLCFLSRCGPPSARELQLASNTQPPTPALNDDDLDDEDTNEEYSIRPSRHREASEVNSEIAEPSPGPSHSSETQPSGDPDERAFDDVDDRQAWPTATDLNTRLRRVITSYQRSYRKEEQQKLARVKPASVESALSSPLAALAQVSQQLDARDAASLAMPGWDLQQLALYLLKMERQGKHMELVAREKERHSIARKWSRREEADFFRVVASFGVNYYRKKKAYDWNKFKQLSKLEKKTDDEMTEYYKSFVVMCKRQMGIKIDEESYDSSIEHISEEKARRTLERLELLARIREEIVTHTKLEDRLKVCLTSADMPEWWLPGRHDKDLLLGVAKHGLGRTDYYILNDPELCFREILRKKVGAQSSETLESKEGIKLESHEDILKFDKNEILVKLEKGEGTLKIEKVNIKKDNLEDKYKDTFKKEDTKIEFTLVKNETDEQTEIETDLEGEFKNVETPKSDTASLLDPKESVDEKEAIGNALDESQSEEKESEVLDVRIKKDDVKLEKELSQKKDVDEESDLCAKQAAELKAMFPDLEVIQPLSRLTQVDTFVLRDKQGSGALDFSETTVAQLFNNAVKWPREYAIQVRLQHIVYAIETKEWPASKSFSAYANGIGTEFDIPIHEIPNDPPKRETSTPMSLGEPDLMSMTADSYHRNSSSKKRKRHIAIDVETERAKLHALLNTSHGGLPTPLPKPSMHWDNEDSEDSRRSTPVTQPLQPPPAHQQTSRIYGVPYEYKYHAPKTIGQTSVIPGTSSTLTPIDLSSGITKMGSPDIPKQSTNNLDVQNEVQDFSLKRQPCLNKPSGNKLDDTLSKLMKRKNCPIEEPVVGKEKKRRKLDEIVLGLSAAKEHMLFPETPKKSPIAPSVTVTPTSAPLTLTSPQKPFTITVTSIPSQAPPSRNCSTPNLKSSMPSKDSFSSFLAQAEQQNLLLKKQHQHQKSYEAMIADINKAADFSSKVGSYSHEAKVNKWLAEQSAALAEPMGSEYLTPRRRRPRVDPSLLDWKKLTGNENVSVIHRVTNKKLTGPKAPTLKRLGQWLMENPMYDVDPKWSELVKERGNLAHDLQKRFGGNSSMSSSLKKGTPGRPPLLSSPTGSTSSVNSSNLPTSLASSLQFPNLSGSGLTGLNSSLLSSLSGLGQFDPKNSLFDPKNPLFDPKNPLFDPKNPLLMPFGTGMPNINALNSMAGLGNLGNMNLFANLAGLGLPGLGMDPSTLNTEASKPKTSVASSTSSSVDNKMKHKPVDAHSSSKPSVTSSPAGIPTSTPFPFFFPNPSLLYTPLGLGGLNPFALQPGMSAAYDTLAQQCNLLNGNMNPAASPNSSSKSIKSARSSTATSTTTVMSHSKSPKSSRDSHLQNLILPPDTQLLESISKVAGTLDPSFKYKDRKDEKHKALDSLRGMLPTDFSSSTDKLRAMKDLPSFADFNKLLEASHTSLLPPAPPKKIRDESYDKINKSNVDLLAQVAVEEHQRATPITKIRDYVEHVEESETKQLSEFVEEMLPPSAPPLENPPTESSVDIESLLQPATLVRAPILPTELDEQQELPMEMEPIPQENLAMEPSLELTDLTPKKTAKRTRGKRKSGDIPLDPESVIERKNLRSSASRSAAVAAARAAKLLEAENALKNQESDCG